MPFMYINVTLQAEIGLFFCSVVSSSGSSSLRDSDGGTWLLLPHLRSRPHSQRRWHFLQVSGKNDDSVAVVVICELRVLRSECVFVSI